MKKFIKIEYSCSYCSICFFSAYVYIVSLLCSMDVQCSDTEYLSNIKLSGSNCITKKYRVPYFNHALWDATLIKYMDRLERFKDLTFIQYIQ